MASTGFSSGSKAKLAKVEKGLKLGVQFPGEAGMNLLDRMRYHNIPNVSVAIFNEGKLEEAKSYSLPKSKEITKETLIQAGSISKPVAAVVALKLVDEKRINLDDDVNEIFKKHGSNCRVPYDNKQEEKITLRRLLSHTAGLTVADFSGYSVEEKELPTLDQILKGKKPANNPPVQLKNIPGKVCAYSGGGTLIVQKLIEVVTGKNFADVAKEKIFNPLGMKDSTFKIIRPEDDLARLAAVGHRPSGDQIPGGWHIYPESAAAGLWTTPSDLVRFAIGIQNNSILSEEMTEAMLTPVMLSPEHSTDTSHPCAFGLGLQLNVNATAHEFYHLGSNDGYESILVGFAGRGKGAVIMTNSANGNALIPELTRSIADAYDWPKGYRYQYQIKQPVTGLDLTAIVDDYKNHVGKFKFGDLDIEISATAGKLYISLPYPSRMSGVKSIELIPISATQFISVEGKFSVDLTGNNDELILFGGAKAQKIVTPLKDEKNSTLKMFKTGIASNAESASPNPTAEPVIEVPERKEKDINKSPRPLDSSVSNKPESNSNVGSLKHRH